MAKANVDGKSNGNANGIVKQRARPSKTAKLSHGRESTHDAEVRRDRLGRRINPKSLENLQKFQPGVSGNPSGSYRSRPFTAAIAIVAEMKFEDLRPKPDDPTALAMTKRLALEAMKGKVPAYTEMADRFEGRTTQRMQFENVPGTTFNVDQKVEGEITVKHELDANSLIETVRQFYGLSGHTYSRKSFVALPVPEGLDRGQQPPQDRDKG